MLPIGLYSDGIKIGEDSQPDTLYAIYVTFPHLGFRKCSELRQKYTYTVFRKSQMTTSTWDDIFDVLLWELEALQHGCEPLVSEIGKALFACLFA